MGSGQGFDGIERHLPSPRAYHDDPVVVLPEGTPGDVSDSTLSEEREPIRTIGRTLGRLSPLLAGVVALGVIVWVWITPPPPKAAILPPNPDRLVAMPGPSPSVYEGNLSRDVSPGEHGRVAARQPRRRSKIRVGVAAPSPPLTSRYDVASAPVASKSGTTKPKKKRSRGEGTITANVPLIHLRDPDTEHHWYTTNPTAATYKVSTSNYQRVETEGHMYDERLPGTKPFRTDQGFMGYIGTKRSDGSFPLWWLTHEDYGDLFTTNPSTVEMARSAQGWHYEGLVGFLFDAGRPAD